jgi:hypothetical protein
MNFMDDPQNPAGPVEGAGDEGQQAPPPTVTTNTPTAPPAASAAGLPASASQNSGQAPAPGAQSPKPEAPVSLQPKPPTTKRTGLAGVVDDMLDDLAGTKGAAKLKKGDDGNYYVDTPELSRKGQWLKIAGEALHGAAAGAAHMQGPGAAGRGLAAGVEAGDKLGEQQQKQAKDVSGEARQANQDRFNSIKLQHDRAMWAFEEADAQHQGTENEIKFNQEEMAREVKPVEQGGLGSQDLGVHANLADLATQMSKTNPKFWKQVYGDTQGSGVVGYKEYGPDGKVTGIHFFGRTPGVNGQYVPEDQAYFNVFKPGKTAQDMPTLEKQKATVPLTVGQQTAYNATADNQMSQWKETQRKQAKEDADLAHVQSETQHEQDDHLAAPGLRAKTAADTAKANREGAAAGPSDPALVDAIGIGNVAPETLSRMLGGKQGEQLLGDVAKAYPDLDTSRLGSYPKLYQDFTSGKTANQRQNLDNAFKAVDDLTKLNTYAARLPVGPARTEWDKRLSDASQEIANGLAKPGTAATQEAGRHVWVTLNPTISRQAAIDKQIDSLMDAYGSMRTRWTEGAPSPAYEAKMPDVGPQTKSIMYRHNPEQAQQWFGKPAFADAPGKPRVMSFDGGKTWQPAQ